MTHPHRMLARWAGAAAIAALAMGMLHVPALAQDGMRFLLAAEHETYGAGAPILLRWSLTNRTGKTWQVLAGEADCDAITLRLSGPHGWPSRNLQLSLPRSAYRPDLVVLPPDQSITRSVDLRGFGAAFGIVFPPGRYTVSATYRMTDMPGLPTPPGVARWTGNAVSSLARFTIEP